ncbi:MAG: hypothetical protein ACYC8T_17465 [Myxococcaceae bacterium]
MSLVRRQKPLAPKPPSFREVKPEHSTPDFRRYVTAALDLLRNSKTEVGRATYQMIARGAVQVDELTDLTRPDFNRVRHTLDEFGSPVGAEGYERLPERKGRAWRAIEKNITGYQWDNRLYVERGLTPEKLARTLVHEVNHIVNRSEENYQGDNAALREEYRAFYVEKQFSGEKMTPARCRALKEEIARDYGLTRAKPGELPDVPPGILVPPRR